MRTLTLKFAGKRRAWIARFLAAVLFCTPWVVAAQSFLFSESSQPAGIFASQSNYVAPGSAVQTVVAPLISSTYGFAYWLVNGQRAVAASGQSLTTVSLVVNTDTAAIAVYVPVSEVTNDNTIPDYAELFYYGSTTNAATSDTDGDGLTFVEELTRGTDPTIPDVTTNGGAILRLSDPATYVAGPLQYFYQFQSQPGGIVPPVSGYAPAGTTVQSPDVPYGQSNGYYFVYWEVSGVPQIGVTGASLNILSLTMTNNTVATAVFVTSTQTAGNLPNWWDLYWFGSANYTANSDPAGDAFNLGQDFALNFSPVVPNVTTNGGAILRLSESFTYSPVQLPCCDTITIAVSEGQLELAWTAGGVLQSAPNINGPYTDVPNAPDPYFVVPTEGQMFFRVRFPQ
jgi:hypothetical protein